MVRLLGVSASGIFFYDVAALSLFVLLISWSMESGITYYCSKDIGIISTLMLVILPLLLVQSLIMVIILKFIQFSVRNYLATIFVMSNITIIYFSAFFYAKKWFVSLNIINCIVNLITALLLFYWWIKLPVINKGKDYFIIAYVLSCTVQALLYVTVILFETKKTTLSFNTIKPVAKKIFTYSSIAFITNIAFFLVLRIDYFFVRKYCTDIALSNYVQVSKFGQLLILVPSIIGSLIFPYSAGNSIILSMDKVQQICRTITFSFIAVAVICILAGSWVFPWMFGNGFNFMYMALILYLPGFFSLSIVTVLSANLAGKKLVKVNLVAVILALVVVVAGDVILIPIGGINAAAAVSSIAYIVCGIYLLWFYKNKFQCNTIDFFSIKKQEVLTLLNQLKKSIIPST